MKVDNIRPQKIDSPYTTRSTWLAQKALRGMKVATPSLNWLLCSLLNVTPSAPCRRVRVD